jgi:peptide/nickel transport system substrate-binding protein
MGAGNGNRWLNGPRVEQEADGNEAGSARPPSGGGGVLAAMTATRAACAQKSGGLLRLHALDSPPSLSMHEEVDANPARAAMGIFNNLVMFDQHAKQNSMYSIIPDLAAAWHWSEEGPQLTFLLREGVTRYDDKPFTEKDVKCT